MCQCLAYGWQILTAHGSLGRRGTGGLLQGEGGHAGRRDRWVLIRSSSERAPSSTSKTGRTPLPPPAITRIPVTVFLLQVTSTASHRLPSLPLFAPSIRSPHSSQNDLFKTHSSSCDFWLKTLLELPVVFRLTSGCRLHSRSLCGWLLGSHSPLPSTLRCGRQLLRWSPVIPSSRSSCLGVVPSPWPWTRPRHLLLMNRRQPRKDHLKADPSSLNRQMTTAPDDTPGQRPARGLKQTPQLSRTWIPDPKKLCDNKGYFKSLSVGVICSSSRIYPATLFSSSHRHATLFLAPGPPQTPLSAEMPHLRPLHGCMFLPPLSWG